MKKLLFIAITGIILLRAQAEETNGLGLRSKLFFNFGFNLSGFSNNNLYNKPLMGGPEMGAKIVTLQPWHCTSEIGLQYINKGAGRDVDFLNMANQKVGSYTENIYLHYVQLHLALKKKFVLTGNYSINLGVGVYNALLFSAWLNPQYANVSREQINSYNIYDAGLTGSLGIMYGENINLYARYEQGLLNVSKANGGINNTFAVGLAFWIDFKSMLTYK